MDGVQLQNRELVERALFAAQSLGNTELPVQHTFAEGVYCRSLFIPAGHYVFGKLHRRETVNICAKGDISVFTEKGSVRFKAGDVVVSAPGIMKVGYAHEDTVWVNVHPTNERDLDKIEELFIAKSYEDLLEVKP